MRARVAVFGVLVLVAGAFVTVASTGTAGATDVSTAAEFETAWELGTTTSIVLLDDITLVGTAPTRPLGASDITIEGNGHTLTAAPNDRVVDFFNPSGNGIWRNITVTGGLAGGGNSAGIGQGGNLTLENVDVFGNTGSNLGAGVYAVGDVMINNSRIHDNSTGGDGPGVYAQGGSIRVTNSTIGPNNDSTGGGDGGGLWAEDDITLIDSSVVGNSATDGGGVSAGSDVTLLRATVSGNTAEFDGGGIDAGTDDDCDQLDDQQQRRWERRRWHPRPDRAR